jgi:Mg2+ and Co2+ transporter CorA
MENQKMNKTERTEAMQVIDQMIDHFDIICEQIYDQIEHLEKIQER